MHGPIFLKHFPYGLTVNILIFAVDRKVWKIVPTEIDFQQYNILLAWKLIFHDHVYMIKSAKINAFTVFKIFINHTGLKYFENWLTSAMFNKPKVR